jgi:hypothetical protein
VWKGEVSVSPPLAEKKVTDTERGEGGEKVADTERRGKMVSDTE